MHKAAHKDNLTVRPLVAADEARIERFVLGHSGHAPGHRRALAAIERALGHRELSVIAEQGGDVVGYAPAWELHGRSLRVLHVRNVSGAGLVSCGPLVAEGLGEATREAVLAALVHGVRLATVASGAQWLRWVLPPVSGQRRTLEAEHPYPLLRQGFSMRLIAGLLAELQLSEAELLRRLKATTRRTIRQAEGAGLRARAVAGVEAQAALRAYAAAAGSAFGGDARAAEAFVALGVALAASQGGDGTPQRSPDASLLHLLVVEREGVPLSAVVTCESNGTAYYFLSFNTTEGLSADGNRVALWQAMLAARARGCRWFQLGSLEYGEGKSARISAFKRHFGGEVVLAPVVEWCARPVQSSVLQSTERVVGWLRGRLRARDGAHNVAATQQE